MKAVDLPFNIELIDLSKERLSTLRPVLTTDISEGATTNFHEDGLFSVAIFGRVGDAMRDKRFSYINIKTQIFHPLIYKSIGQLKGLYKDIMAGKAYAVWDDEAKDFVGATEVEGDTGFQFFVKHWRDIKFKTTKSTKRTQRIKLIEKYKDRAMTDKILVMPAGLRDVRMAANGRLEQDEINDLYRRIIGISRTIADTNEKGSSVALNYSRHLLQLSFNAVYDMLETMLSGKKGFIQEKWGSRKIFNGTRNVISSMDTSVEYLGGRGSPQGLDTVLGLYQVIKGALPLTVHYLRNGWLSHAFGVNESSTTARLVDKKTWEAEMVDLAPDAKDKWTTLDGLEKIINSYQNVANRHKPIMVEGRYLGLIYKGPDNTFKIFGDIRELPEGMDRKHVSPLTLVELLYLSGYREWNKLRGFVTRYPVNNLGSTYPTTIYTKTSVVGETRYELGDDWQRLGEEYVAEEFPTRNPEAFVDSQIISPTRLAGLNADFDGDTCSMTLCYSEEALAEINKHLASKEAYLDPRGGLRTSADVNTVALVLRNMTGDA